MKLFVCLFLLVFTWAYAKDTAETHNTAESHNAETTKNAAAASKSAETPKNVSTTDKNTAATHNAAATSKSGGETQSTAATPSAAAKGKKQSVASNDAVKRYVHPRLEFFKKQPYYPYDAVLRELVALGETYVELPRSINDVLIGFEKAYGAGEGVLSLQLDESYRSLFSCYDKVAIRINEMAFHKQNDKFYKNFIKGKEQCSFFISLLFTDKKAFMAELEKESTAKRIELARIPILKEIESVESLLHNLKREEQDHVLQHGEAEVYPLKKVKRDIKELEQKLLILQKRLDDAGK